MGCRHSWHECGPWYGPANGPDWYGPADWVEEPPRARRRRRYGRLDDSEAGEDLESRLAELRDEVRRVEARLADLRDQKEATLEGR
jgi:uncharacterized small protein (DUF1192 family)